MFGLGQGEKGSCHVQLLPFRKRSHTGQRLHDGLAKASPVLLTMLKDTLCTAADCLREAYAAGLLANRQPTLPVAVRPSDFLAEL